MTNDELIAKAHYQMIWCENIAPERVHEWAQVLAVCLQTKAIEESTRLYREKSEEHEKLQTPIVAKPQ